MIWTHAQSLSHPQRNKILKNVSSTESVRRYNSTSRNLLDYKFKNQELLVEALYISQQPAFIGGRVIQEANKQLAKAGQAAMNLAVVDKAYAAEKSTGTLLYLANISSTFASSYQYSNNKPLSFHSLAPSYRSLPGLYDPC